VIRSAVARWAPAPGGLAAAARQALVRDTLGTLGLNVATTVLNFALVVTLARLLGASGYGAYAFAFAWATVLTVPAVLGLTPLVVRNVAAYHQRGAWVLVRGILRRSNQVVLASSALVSFIAAGAGWLLLGSDSELRGPFLIGMLLVPLLSLVTLRQAAMQGLSRVVVGRVPETVVAPVLFLAFALVGSGVAGDSFSASWAVALQVAATVLAFLLGAFLLVRTLPSKARAAAPEYDTRAWLRSGLSLLAMSVALAVNLQLGTILVGAIQGSSEAGVFNAASRVALFVSFLYLAATYPLMPAVARLHAAARTEELQRLLTRAVRAIFVCSLPVAAVFLAFASQLLDVFGGGFDAGAASLRILVAGELVKLVTGFAGLTLLMSAHERDFTTAAVAAVALNLALSVALIPGQGAEGAAVATAVSVGAMNVYLAVAVTRRVGVSAALIGIRRGLRRRSSAAG
jgi:O-antigen/teichoic acid export membrane protein